MAEQTEGEIQIDASPQEVFAVISDYEAYPQWAEGIKKAEVKKKDSQGRPSEVSFEVSQMGVGAKYTLAYTYRAKDGGVSWTTTAASGAVKDIKGEYGLEPSGNGTTVTYRTTIEPAIPMMGFMKRQAEKMIIGIALEGLKKRVESL
ncbi:MAG TPA: SRPBCC family protein [Actinomycetota bacterium]|nr:SRPBCC family protein [Actinomycetota bacterium]